MGTKSTRNAARENLLFGTTVVAFLDVAKDNLKFMKVTYFARKWNHYLAFDARSPDNVEWRAILQS